MIRYMILKQSSWRAVGKNLQRKYWQIEATIIQFKCNMSESKIDEVLRKLNFLIEKSTAMQTSIDNFNERISVVENKITNLESEVEEIKQTKADYDKVNDFQAKTDAALDKLKNRCDDLEEYVQKANHRSRVDALMNELYSKKFNLLIYGIKENEQNVWETKTESGKLVYDFMRDVLLLKNPEIIKLADLHRLP